MSETATDTTPVAPAAPPPDMGTGGDRGAANALFAEALAGAGESVPDVNAPPPNGETTAQEDAPPETSEAAPAPPPPTPPAPPKDEKKRTKNVFAEARELNRGLTAKQQRLDQELQAVAREKARLEAISKRAQQAGQYDEAQAQLHRDLARLLDSDPSEFVSRLAKLKGTTEQEIMRRIQVRSTVGAEVDDAQRALQELRAKQAETDKRFRELEEQRKREAAARTEAELRAEYNGAINTIRAIATDGADEKDVETWPQLAATHPDRVERDLQIILAECYRDVDGFRPTVEVMQQIANALDKRYGVEHKHANTRLSRGSGVDGSLSQATRSTPVAKAAAAGTGTQKQPVSASAGNGTRAEIAAAPTSGAHGEMDESVRRARAAALFQEALHGKG